MKTFEQVILVILDGFGVASPSNGNAVTQAHPVNIDYLINHFPATTLQASGPSVGLPWGERGNSEVGHLNLGAGRIVSQDLPRINRSITSGEFRSNEALLAALEHTKKNNSQLHLVGLVSPGGVHSAEEHLYALLSMAAEKNVPEVRIHMITDGRDTAPKVALTSLDRLMRKMIQFGVGKIATLVGRFYAMDRGGHWELTERTFQAIVAGKGVDASSPREAIQDYYEQEIYDETIPPTVFVENGEPVGRVMDGDAVVFFNFRPDRMTQLVRALISPNFDKFTHEYKWPENIFTATMTLYDDDLDVGVMYPPQQIVNGLSEVVSKKGMSQFHTAESEKYAHVTSFFSGGRQQQWPGEEREIVASPSAYQKRYEDTPEMSIDHLTHSILEKLHAGTNFIVANVANPDMVGHTGNLNASINAVKAVDKSLGLIFEAVMQEGAVLVVTADHGNIEQVIDPRIGRIDKEHSLNPVPLILAGNGLQLKKPREKGYVRLASVVPEGVLSDVAPTVLELFGIEKPKEMTAISLMKVLLQQIEGAQNTNKEKHYITP